MNAREEVLARIRAAWPDGRPDVEVPRTYRTSEPEDDPGALLGLLADRLADYGARVDRVAPGEAAGAAAEALRLAGARTAVLAPGLAPALPEDLLTEVRVVPDDPPLSAVDLDAVDAAVVSVAVAIAETGTLVLDGAAGGGRRALTLVPDVLVCLVPAVAVVRGVPAALSRLDPRRPLTFVSGPSATSDIELQRVEGVHGPRRLVAVLVE